MIRMMQHLNEHLLPFIVSFESEKSKLEAFSADQDGKREGIIITAPTHSTDERMIAQSIQHLR